MPQTEVTIKNRRGLHARAAAKFVKLAESYDATVTVEKDGARVSGRSIMSLLMLAASPGCRIVIDVDGPHGDAALAALSDLVTSGFGEER